MIGRAILALSVSAALCFLGACGDSTPTGASDVAPPSARSLSDFPSTHPSPTAAGTSLAGPAYAAEDFTCVNVGAVRIRFSAPGYVEDDRVGLYVSFEGIPEGRKRLRIWWNNENEPGVYSDSALPEDAVDLEEVYEYQYRNLTGPTEMLVRVELILDGVSGNCPRNRRVVVAPPSHGGGSPPGPAPPATTQSATIGPSIASIDAADFNYFEGVRFTASRPLTIDSVRVSPQGPGTLVINLYDDTGSTLFNTTSMAVTAGAQAVTLGFTVQPGDYILSLDGTTVGAAGVGMTFGGASYPYDIPGVISLNDTAFYLGFFGFYYYLYDWQITW
jgi:hypothetical protein